MLRWLVNDWLIDWLVGWLINSYPHTRPHTTQNWKYIYLSIYLYMTIDIDTISTNTQKHKETHTTHTYTDLHTIQHNIHNVKSILSKCFLSVKCIVSYKQLNCISICFISDLSIPLSFAIHTILYLTNNTYYTWIYHT